MSNHTKEQMSTTPRAAPHTVPKRRPGPLSLGLAAASPAPREPAAPPAGQPGNPCGNSPAPAPAAAAMRAAGPQPTSAAAGEPGSDARGEQPRQKIVYVEPPRRVKKILEEHFHFQKEECNVKHPAAVALEGVWNVKNNFCVRSLKPVSQNSSDLLLQPQFYSRHARMKNC